jgi:HAD superfamily hydrolase (TIGR01484 family)
MNRVYIFSRPCIPKVRVAGQEMDWKRLNTKWIHLDIESKELSLEYPRNTLSFILTGSTQFAIYKDELIPLKTSLNRILLISDIDNTLFNKTSQAKSAYHCFIRFWIENYEFSGSKLVYNTGRCLAAYNKDKDEFYEPDLLMSVLGNYAYKYDNDENLVLQESFDLFVEQFKNTDWDADEYYEDFKGFFPWITSCFISKDPYNLYFKIPRIENDERMDEISKHVKNENQRKINGKLMEAKTIITGQGSQDIWSLEIIPKFAGKGLAVRYAQWILGFSDFDTFTAGDSLNDKDAFKIQIRGVIVGNAEESLVQWYSKKQRNHLYLSSQHYALGIIDLLTTYNLQESPSKIYIYKPEFPNPSVLIQGKKKPLETFKQKWSCFETNQNSFELESPSLKFLEIPKPGRYALFDSTLIQITPNLSPILLVSDLDNTLFNDTEAGVTYYKDFLKFWLTFHEFNGSFLVYNTGRNMPHYLEDEYRLFKPDLILLCLSSFAYFYDKNLSLKQDLDLEKNNFSLKHDWDTSLFTEALCEKFNLNREVVIRSYDTYILLKLEEDFALQHYREIRTFSRNKEKKLINGRVFHAEVTLIQHNLIHERYLEIRPLFVGKGIGLRYAQKKFSFSNENIFAAGDSPNDIDSLKLPVNGIVMSNSEELLLEWFRKKIRKNLMISEEKWAKGLEIELEKRLII